MVLCSTLSTTKIRANTKRQIRSSLALPSNGKDFAGPIYFTQIKKKEFKAYTLLFSCSLSKAVHLELQPNLITHGYIISSKCLITCRVRSKTGYQD